jgi:hypothetical protein
MAMSGRLATVNKFFPKVKVVVDANRNAFIEVTKADASSKAVKNHNACAMAVACKRKFKLDGVIISRSVAYLIKGTQARRFKLPESVSREVVSFDRGGGFAPGKYELSHVPPSMSEPRQTSRDRGDRGSKPKRFKHVTTNVRSVLGGTKPDDE